VRGKNVTVYVGKQRELRQYKVQKAFHQFTQQLNGQHLRQSWILAACGYLDTINTNSDYGNTAGALNVSLYPLIDEADNQTANVVNIFPVKA
jgi:hypothetical protein